MGRSLATGSVSSGGGVTEKPKVFLNGTLTGDQLTGGDTYTVFTNDAQTTSVLESLTFDPAIQIKFASGPAGKASVLNGVTKVGEAVDSEGNVVYAPSTAMTLKLPKPLVTGTTLYYPNGYRYYLVQSSSVVGLGGEFPFLDNLGGNYSLNESKVITERFDAGFTVETPVSTTKSVPSMTSPTWYIEVGNRAYHFNYDGSGTTNLLRADITNNVVGQWSNINAASQAYKALDLDQLKVRWVEPNSFIRQHNLVTNQTTNLAGSVPSGSAPSSFHSAGSVNGVLFWIQSSSNTTTVFFFNSNTSTAGSFPIVAATITGNVHFGASYNPFEDRYYLAIGSSTQTKLYSVPGNLSSSTLIGTNSAPYPNGWGNMKYCQGNARGEMFIENINGAMETVIFENNVVFSVEIIPSIAGFSSPFDNGGWFPATVGTPQTATLTAGDYEVKIKALITGTEYKES